jgi:hypothetical protein
MRPSGKLWMHFFKLVAFVKLHIGIVLSAAA